MHVDHAGPPPPDDTGSMQANTHTSTPSHMQDPPQPKQERGSTEKPGPRPSRRKKASRACYHCQKAHLTCDDSRPCQRCIRKGLADQCVDGYRKKAKYLLEEDEIRACASAHAAPKMHHSMSSDASHPTEMFASSVPETMPMSNQAPAFAPRTLPHLTTASALFKPTSQLARMDAKPVTMDSGAGSGFDPTWLECSILSSMLHDADSGLVNSDSPDVPTAPAMELMDSYTHVNNVLPHDLRNDDTLAPHLSWNAQHPPMQPMLQKPVASEFGDMHVYPEQGVGESSHAPRLMGPTAGSMSASHTADTTASSSLDKANVHKRPDESASAAEHDSHNDNAWKQRVADVYRGDTKPFRYTEGYHILLKYVTQKYEKSDVLRIVRALAIFRPSLIALQMALSEEDEKFVERAFQRTMLEFEKLISFSGTPTVVWRRTCEICVVGAEFCMLTQWSKEDLLGKYMYQFMDKDSVLNYWEQFASHAFENTTPSVMTTCVLLNPSGKRIPCTWCFTIKRDPFDLPAYVVGNFLPILS